jgi:hypothetical protein
LGWLYDLPNEIGQPRDRAADLTLHGNGKREKDMFIIRCQGSSRLLRTAGCLGGLKARSE